MSLFKPAYATLLNASFKGVEFVVIGDEGLEKFGRNLVVTEYPNTSEQFAEDTGGFSGSYSLTIAFVGQFAFEDYESFKRACNEPGFGDLILPMQGEVKVKAGECKPIIRPNESAQYIEVLATFHTSRAEAGFVPDVANLNSVLSLAEEARASFEEFFSSNIFVQVNDALSKLVVITDIENMLHDLQYIVKQTTAPVTDILDKIDQIEYNLNYLSQPNNLDQLSKEMDELFSITSTSLIGHGTAQVVIDLANAPANFEANLSTQIDSRIIPSTGTNGVGGIEAPIQAPGEDVNNQGYWLPTTSTRIARNSTRELLTAYYSLNMLLLGYELLPSLQLDTDAQATVVKDTLEASYQAIFLGVGVTLSGTQLQSSNNVKLGYTNQLTFDKFNTVRLSALEAQEGTNNVQFKIESINLGDKLYSNNITFTYAALAEGIKNEQELLDTALTLRNQNNRATFMIRGIKDVLRKVE